MMGVVRLAFAPKPAHVRIARLVAVATAREAGVDEELLDEIRLAVGEACSRAVGLHRQHGRSDLVVLEFTVGERFGATVRDTAPAGLTPPAGPPVAGSPFGGDGFSEEAVVAGVGLALLTGLVDDVSVTAAAEGVGTLVEMSWPLG
ncbi:MAG TPA: ATP-binding protein [Cryptosporangiaceae bacterium]|nr:ATP-binding protein [Cryptosporangiaceae bacterium]